MTHPPGTWYLAPSSDPDDEWSAGYDGNVFASRDEAVAAVPGLLACGPEFAGQWIPQQRTEATP